MFSTDSDKHWWKHEAQQPVFTLDSLMIASQGFLKLIACVPFTHVNYSWFGTPAGRSLEYVAQKCDRVRAQNMLRHTWQGRRAERLRGRAPTFRAKDCRVVGGGVAPCEVVVRLLSTLDARAGQTQDTLMQSLQVIEDVVLDDARACVELCQSMNDFARWKLAFRRARRRRYATNPLN